MQHLLINTFAIQNSNLSQDAANRGKLETFFDSTVYMTEIEPAMKMTGWMFVGGLIALYLRFLYRRFSASASDTDSISRVFPLLVMVTTAVIALVHTSLALSLGLVGALSIVRFRAAIKDPEELVYLFLCISVGLALGAQKAYLALGLVAASSLLIIGMHVFAHGSKANRLLLTIRGNAALFSSSEEGVPAVVDRMVASRTLHRMDIENGRGQLRIALQELSPQETSALIAQLSEALPDCEFSYVNMNSAV